MVSLYITNILFLALWVTCNCQNFDDYLVFSPNPFSILNLNNTIEDKSSPLSIVLLPIFNLKQYAYVSHENGKLSLLDVSDVQSPLVIKTFQFTQKQIGKSIQTSHENNLLWYIKQDIIEIISIVDPNNPFLLFAIEKQPDLQSQSAHFVNLQIIPNTKRLVLLRFKRFDIIDLNFDAQQVASFQNPIDISQAYTFVKSLLQNNGGEIRYIQFSSDYSLVITSDSQEGLVFYSSNNFLTDQNPTFTKLCSRVAIIGLTHKIQLVQDQFLYVLDTSAGLYLYDISQIVQQKKCGLTIDSNGQYSKEFLVLIDKAAQTYTLNTLIFTKKEEYALVLRSDRVVIYDLRDRNRVIQQQELTIDTDAINISLSNLEDYFTITGFNTISFFLRSEQNFNKDVPNLLNIYQSFNFNEVQIDQWGYSCKFDEKKQILINERNNEGLFIYQVGDRSLDLRKIAQIKPPQSNWQAGTVSLIHNGNVMIIGYNRFGVIFYDISDLTNIQELSRSSLTGNVNQDSDLISFSSDENYMLIANGYVGVTMVDISNVKSPIVLWSETFNIGYQSYEGVAIDKNTKYAYACARAYGIFSFDITSIKFSPNLISTIRSRGAESLNLTEDGKYLIVADGLYGIQIIDVQNSGIMKTVSKIHLDAHIWKIHVILQDNYLLTSQTGQKISNLIDMNDKKNPFILQRLAFPDITDSFDLCMKKDLQQMYYITLKGVFAIDTLPSITLHTERTQYYYNESGQLKSRILSKKEKLLVGSNIDFTIIQIRKQLKIKIYKVQLYNQFQLSDLPFWIKFSYEFWKATLSVSKEGLIATKEGEFVESFQYLVLVIFEEVQQNSFVDTTSKIDVNQSKQIYQNCITQGILTKSGFLTSQPILDAQSSFVDTSLTSEQAEFVSQVLMSKVIYYPISFVISPSLSFDFSSLNSNNNNLSSINIINSLQDQVSLTITFLHQDCIFFNTKYPGVLVSLSPEQDKLKIEGSLKAVNQVLQNKIRVIIINNSSNTKINFSCQDSANYPIKSTQTLQNLERIISYNKPVTQNPNISIQQDFKNQFENSSIYIKTSFIYQINRNTFIDSDEDPLTFEVKLLDRSSLDGEGLDLPADYWIQYSPSELKISGNPGYDVFRQSVWLKIIASDGYSKSSQILEIKVTLIPLTIVFTFFISIISPILGICGFWKYKHIAHNIYNHQSLISSKEIAYVGQVYQKQIPLVGVDIFPLAKNIWKLYQDEWQKLNVLDEIWKLKSQNQNAESELAIVTPEQVQNQPKSPNKFILLDKLSESDQLTLYPEKSSLQSIFKFNKRVKRIESKLSSRRATKNFQIQIQSRNNSLIRSSKKDYNLNKDTIDCLEINNNSQSLFLKNNQFNKQGFLNNLVNTIVKINEKKRIPRKLKDKIAFILEELSNTQSRLSVAVISIAIQNILVKDEYTFSFFNFLRDMTSLTHGIHTWFQPFIKQIPVTNNLKDNPFPTIEINYQNLNDAKNYLIHKNQLTNHYSLIVNQLVHEAIISHAYGFSIFKPQTSLRPKGISIHENPQNVSSIKAFIQQKKSHFSCLSRYGLDFQLVSLSHNLSLPSWITTVDLIHGVIIIGGTPEAKDCGQILIRVFDQKQYILKQFIIEVTNQQQGKIVINQQNQNISPRYAKQMEDLSLEEKPITCENQFSENEKDFITYGDYYKLNTNANNINTIQTDNYTNNNNLAANNNNNSYNNVAANNNNCINNAAAAENNNKNKN